MNTTEISLVLFAVLLLVIAACSERQAQVAVQTSLTTIAHSVEAVDEIGDERYADAASEVRARVINEATEEQTPDEMFDAYNELMTPWDQLVTAVAVSAQVLLVGQSAFNVWVSSGELPREWGRFCAELSPALEAVVDILTTLEVQVPESLELAIPSSSTICNLTADYFGGSR